MLYGGLPQILSYKTDEHKTLFLKSLFEETYIKDIKERYNIRKDDDLEELKHAGFRNRNTDKSK